MMPMKIWTFFKSLYNSITSRSYYIDVLNAKFAFSFKFFLVGYFLLAILAGGLFIGIDLPKYQSLFVKNTQLIQKQFPSDLKLNWDGTTFLTNQKNPIRISYPDGMPHDGLPEDFAYLAAADSSLSQAEEAVKSSSLMIFSKDTLAISEGQSGWSTLSLKDAPGFDQPFTITAESLPDQIKNWQQIFSAGLSLFALLYPVLFLFGVGMIRLVSLCINSVLIYYLLKVFGRTLPYAKVIQLGMHISVVAGLLDVITSHLITNSNFNLYEIAFWCYLMIIIFSIWNVKNVPIFQISPKNVKK